MIKHLMLQYRRIFLFKAFGDDSKVIVLFLHKRGDNYNILFYFSVRKHKGEITHFIFSFSEKPLYLQNSRLTNTTSRLSQHRLGDTEKYCDRVYAESLGDLAKDLENVSRNVGDTLRRSVTFSEHQLPKSLKDSINRRSLEREYDERKQYRESFGGLPVDQERALWYTQPVHLSRQEYSLSPRHGASSRARSPHKYSGTIGAALSMQNESKKEHKDGERLSLLNVSDSIGLKYFPVTLGASYELSDLDRKLSELERIPRPRTAIPYVKTSYEPESVNSMYLMGSEAPATSKISNVFVASILKFYFMSC